MCRTICIVKMSHWNPCSGDERRLWRYDDAYAYAYAYASERISQKTYMSNYKIY